MDDQNTLKFFKFRTALLALLAFAASGLSADAQKIFDGPALSYNYLDFGYERRFFDEALIDDADGVGAEFSFAPLPLIFFSGEFHYANADASAEDFLRGKDIDFLEARLGGGLRLTLLGTLSGYLEGGVAYGELDRPGSDGPVYDGTGFYLEPGLKLGIFGRLEGSVAAEFVSLDSENYFGAKAGLVLGVTDNLGITVDGGFTEHSDFVGVGVRLNW